jgi:hypothetical protein
MKMMTQKDIGGIKMNRKYISPFQYKADEKKMGLSFGRICPRCRSQNPQRSAATPPVLFSLLRTNPPQNSAPTIFPDSGGDDCRRRFY